MGKRHFTVQRNRKESKRDSAPFLKTPLLTLQNSGLPSERKTATNYNTCE